MAENLSKKGNMEPDSSVGEIQENWVSETSRFRKMVDRARYYITHQEKLNELISEAYNKATQESGRRTVQEMWDKLLTLFKMIRSHFRREYTGFSTSKMIVGIAVLLYFVLPFDIIPDWLPVGGFIDDASLLTWFIKNSADEVNKFREWEAQQSPAPLPAY